MKACCYLEWIGHVHPFGCRPVRFVRLFVDQAFSALARFKASTHLWINSGRCSARWSDLDTKTRLAKASFSLFPSRWCTEYPGGIGPFSDCHTSLARRTQTLGSAIFTNARCSPFLLCLVLTLTVPTGTALSDLAPFMNVPAAVLVAMSVTSICHDYSSKLRPCQAKVRRLL